MATPKKRTSKRRKTAKIKVKAKIEKKDTLKQAAYQPPRDAAPTFRIKVKRKRK